MSIRTNTFHNTYHYTYQYIQQNPILPILTCNFTDKNAVSLRESKENKLDFFTLRFHPVHHGLGLGVSIQQHQGFSRHRNEATQALRCKFRSQDDGFSMMLSKQGKSTKVCLSALISKHAKTKTALPIGQPFFQISMDHFKHL